MKENILQTGALRAYLAKTLSLIEFGDIDIAKAAQITKMAAQINESIYAEMKVAQVRTAAGLPPFEMGAMPLGISQ